MAEKLYLKFDPDRVTFDQMIALQEASGGTLRQQKEMLVPFVTDGDGKPLAEAEANALLGQLTMAQMKATFSAFNKQVEEAMSETLPNEPGPS